MTSSTLTGERRYPSGRRSGMVTLGKVAVPKPINLPSQRLENHGLDPNVEIVPKGTHSWGTRSSSSTPNAWGSSTLSPNTDGGNGSPSHLSGRPSSGGSGTRPSTASSDRTHDPIASAWVKKQDLVAHSYPVSPSPYLIIQWLGLQLELQKSCSLCKWAVSTEPNLSNKCRSQCCEKENSIN
ncbi:PROTEIN MODIFIER OF SNC1 1 [Salix koriyanagi]|uniref:PROTEIN MODIFIER OF SNC1 1 n=1 Tax=Salix koriyanagi TaxID=2511006 RepID=A0A9Q0SSV4_9ROSI|nr:PROTEIN MODIFIER OF SNC1 1 [Salix koriyanagi]